VTDQAGGRAQNPPRQMPVQHAALLVQATPIGVQMGAPPASPVPTGGGSGASHDPFVQLEVQQSKPVVQAPAVGVQTVAHVLVVGSQ